MTTVSGVPLTGRRRASWIGMGTAASTLLTDADDTVTFHRNVGTSAAVKEAWPSPTASG